MISRLLLIGMVGALGVSLPGGPDWGNGLSWARGQAAAPVAGRNAVAFDPIAVDEDAVGGLGDELNRQSEGLDIRMAPVVCVVSRPRNEFAAAPSGDSVELKLMAELCRVAEVAESRGTRVDTAVDDLFAENRVWAEPAIEAAPASLADSPEPIPSFEAIAIAEAASNLADELNRASEGIDIEPAKSPVSAPRRPGFEPIAVSEDASNLADELNRASEGQSVGRRTDRGVANAIRLTRNAALAWVNVLTNTMTDAAPSR